MKPDPRLAPVVVAVAATAAVVEVGAAAAVEVAAAAVGAAAAATGKPQAPSGAEPTPQPMPAGSTRSCRFFFGETFQQSAFSQDLKIPIQGKAAATRLDDPGPDAWTSKR
jgi:hypothetical protein